MYFTDHHGRENLREMKKDYFLLKQDARGRRFYQKKAQYETKKHNEEDIGNDEIGITKLLKKYIYLVKNKYLLGFLVSSYEKKYFQFIFCRSSQLPGVITKLFVKAKRK